MNRDRSADETDAVAALESALARLAALEPALDGLRGEAATTDRARRTAQQLLALAGRILDRLERAAPDLTPPTWQGQERRSPNRATNVARLPERAGAGEPPAPAPADWEPF